MAGGETGEFTLPVRGLDGWLRDGEIDASVGGTYPLEEAAHAHRDLQQRRSTGKLLLSPEGS
ncbi:zinc-binding dehydrogenase [Streptomyces tubercidicus]|nr:zinc-binding dehydrogenase [Streptomyces tubercidicus]WAU10092.1 zinc-binding dehydrogenase [Streptomyces tubercidicus]